jgi:tol-pal system protein YbgF
MLRPCKAPFRGRILLASKAAPGKLQGRFEGLEKGFEGAMKGSFFASLASWPARLAIVAATAAFVLSVPVGAQDSTRRQEYRPGPSAAGGSQQRGQALAAAQAQGDSGQLEKRLERIEEQLVDMQSMIGAVESIARNGASAGAGAGSVPDSGGGASYGGDGGDVSARVQGLETQLRALSNQMNEILDRLSRLDGQSGGSAPRGGRQGAIDTPPGGRAAAAQLSGFGGTSVEPVEPDAADNAIAVGPAAESRGGAVAGRPPAGYDSGRGQSGPGNASGDIRQRLSAGPPAGGPEPAYSSSPEARRFYDQAYGLLIARDFQGATDGFSQFLQRYGNDPLAGSAQYWLGQASFELGEYRKAADMFLKGYTDYPRSEKAPESLLKLGISLKRLNQKDAACDSFAEFGRRFPQAPQALQQRAEQEKRRAGCTS